MINFKRQPTHLMAVTALAAVLCAAFAPAQAGLLGGGSVARPLGANGQLGVQLSGATSANTPSADAPLRKLSSGVQRGQAAATDAVGEAKTKAETTGQSAAARTADAASSASTRSPSVGANVSATGDASAQGSAGAKH